jgi:glycosyltransferase involved in cell wall biosynthesis
MRILIGTETYYPDVNGCSYFSQRLAAGLKKRGHDVHVIYPSRRIRSTQASHSGVFLHGLPSISLPTYKKHFRLALTPFFYKTLLQNVSQIKPDVIHLQSHFFIGRALCRIAQDLSIPIIATNHFTPINLTVHLPVPERLRELVNNWIWQDFISVYNQIETIATPTLIAAKLIEKQGISKKIIVVSCGIDLNVFHPQTVVAKDNRPTYLYVGRLEKEKHIDDLIKALPLVREKIDAQLIIVGTGKQYRQLVKLAKKEQMSDYITFTGFVEDRFLPTFYATCDVFCIPGIAELQSIVTMEAMAMGKPVIAADALALPHLVHNGLNGYTYQSGDIETLAANLIKILSNKKERALMGKNSLAIIKEHDIQKTLVAYEKIYDSLINKRESMIHL